MKLQTLKSIIEKKKNKSEFAIITNISTGESFIFEKNKTLDANFEKYSDEINDYFEISPYTLKPAEVKTITKVFSNEDGIYIGFKNFQENSSMLSNKSLRDEILDKEL